MFRHLQPYFNRDITELVNSEPFSSLFDEQRIGRLKPNAPVLINSNRYDRWCLDRGQPARPRLVRPGRRRRIPHQRGTAVPEQGGGQPRAADAGRRGGRDAVDRRPIQRAGETTPNCGQF